MQFRATKIANVFVIELDVQRDDRGFFGRGFCRDEFERQGLATTVVQINNSLSRSAGTLRGLHYQVAPMGEAKLVRCIRGSAYDVAVDLREGSTTFGQWFGTKLTAENRCMMYVPEGCAHGFLTLADDTEMLYLTSAPYSAPHERIVRWNDSRFAITWPRVPTIMSEKDKSAKDFSPENHASGY